MRTHPKSFLSGCLLPGQTANKHHQRSCVIFSELLSECRHFAFNAVQNSRLNSFVGLFHLVEIWPFVSGCINAVAVRTIKGEQLCSGRDLRIFGRTALRSRFTGGHGNIGLNDARRSHKAANDRSRDQQGGNLHRLIIVQWLVRFHGWRRSREQLYRLIRDS